MLKGIVFDLDDTLYLEEDYVRSGFRAIANYVSAKTKINKKAIFSVLWSSFKNGVRGKNFNLLFDYYPYLDNYVSLKELVSIYRLHYPEIELLPDAKMMLYKLRDQGFKLAIVSDGYYASQKKKVAKLGLYNLVDLVILTDEFGQEYWKPHPHAFELCQQEFGLSGNQLCYIADNVKKDFIAPNSLGWITIRLRIQGQLRYMDEANLEDLGSPMKSFNSFNSLYNFLKKQGRR